MAEPMSMAELRQTIEGIHSNSPQRLQLAKTYLDSLVQALKGLETMGQKLAFTILPPPDPIPYPRMVYKQEGKRTIFKIAQNSMEEMLLLDLGYRPRNGDEEPKPEPDPEPVPIGEPPVFSVTLGGKHGN